MAASERATSEADALVDARMGATRADASRRLARVGVACVAAFSALAIARTGVGGADAGARTTRGVGRLGVRAGAGVRGAPRVFEYAVVAARAHDAGAFTQGLSFCGDGVMCESTGASRGESTVRTTEAESGRVMATSVVVDAFAEGLARDGNVVHVISWRSNKGYSYDVGADGSLRPKWTFTTPLRDGWGAAAANGELYVTDASDSLHVLSLPKGDGDVLTLKRSVRITDGDKAIRFANELEIIDGELYANILERPCLARIDPSTGAVTAWVNLQGLKETAPNNGRGEVLNGIAFDEQNDRLFVTGKMWPTMFEITLRESEDVSDEKLRATRRACWPADSLPQYGYP